MSLTALTAEQLTQDKTRWSIAPLMPNPALFSALARSFLAGEQTLEQVVARASHTLGKAWPWLPDVAARYLAQWSGRTRPTHDAVHNFLFDDATLNEHILKLNLADWFTGTQRMQPAPAAKNWDLPPIETPGDLAASLSLEITHLEWFADVKALGYKIKDKPRLRNYRYRAFQKKTGGLRLVESPKPRLKQIQRQLLSGILNRIPIHDAVHGFRTGRSIKTFAASHAGKHIVLRLDLRDFFPSIAGVRIQTFFRTAGYPEPVADLLGGLCTNATPRDIWPRFSRLIDAHTLTEAATQFARPHLPQGAPTSPALANLCAYRLDARLAGLATAANAVYTRYADDLAFSGDASFAAHIHNFAAHVAAIAKEEGFAVQHHKTRIMRQGVAQHLAGLTVNQHPNIPRADFDTLKATLTNCIRHGHRSQNHYGHLDFRAQLQGRVAFVAMVNPAKGQRLQKLFDQVRWD